MKELLIHLARIADPFLFPHAGVFELFGVDFLLDENLNLWIMDINQTPELVAATAPKTRFLKQMIKDSVELQYSYLRSRMKRILEFMKNYYSELRNHPKDPNYEYLINEFQRNIQNSLEYEFTPSEENKFELIIDMNLPGTEAYSNLVQDNCI
jgi:hypothetical protein